MSQEKKDTSNPTGGDEPTPAEAREAEALRRALAGERPDSAPPPEALETAALLRYAGSAGGLDPARREALRGRLRSALPGRRRRRWIWALAPLSVAAAAAVLMTVPLWQRSPPPVSAVAPHQSSRRLPATAPRLPAPSPSLLEAQAAAARGNRAALATLDLEMRAYRQAMLDRLLDRGGGQRR